MILRTLSSAHQRLYLPQRAIVEAIHFSTLMHLLENRREENFWGGTYKQERILTTQEFYIIGLDDVETTKI